MRRVTKENLTVQIDRLYKIKEEQGQLSMSGEYTLQAYEMLLATMDGEPIVPEGYKIVPTELTSEMVKAFRSFCEAYDVDLIAGYKAMLEAAQKE